MAVENRILRRGGVQEGRHRETRLLAASATAIHSEKVKINKLLDDAEKMRFPARLLADKYVADHNRERALEALKMRQKG